MKHVVVSAPGKLLLLGDHAVVHDHSCLVTAVNYRVSADVSIAPQDTFDFPSGNGDAFVQTALALFRKTYDCPHQFNIKTRAAFDQSYGLGSSSAVTVAVISALAQLCDRHLSPEELFTLCYKTVLAVQGAGSGFDIAAAVWGGTLFYFTGGKTVEPLSVPEIPLIVAYSGSKGDTAALVRMVAEKMKKHPESVTALFDKSERLVGKGKSALLQRDWDSFGQCMNENHSLLQQLGVSSPRLDQLVNVARDAGAFGAKLSGAGGGDCVIALSRDEKSDKVRNALERVGGTIIPVTVHEPGVRTES